MCRAFFRLPPRIGWGKDGSRPDVEVVLREAVRAVEVPHSCAKDKNAHEWVPRRWW
jgi:hypothetical protein